VNAHSNSLNQLPPLGILIAQKLKLTRAHLTSTAGRFEAFSPLATLSRGYSVTYSDGKIVTDSSKVKKGSTVSVRLAKGSMKAEVTEIN
jgi:exodeoxyribonuclease VII large subunit